MKNFKCFFAAAFCVISLSCLINFEVSGQGKKPLRNQFIKISKQYPRYFETQDGAPWIPVELNYPIFRRSARHNFQIYTGDQQVIEDFEATVKVFSENGGNSIRIWGGPSDFLEVEDNRMGQFNLAKLENFAALVRIAYKYNVRLKFCLNVSRSFEPSAGTFYKKNYSLAEGGAFSSFAQYIDSSQGRAAYLKRFRVYASRFKTNPTIYDWELWNEMNTISKGDWFSFTKVMLDSVKKIAPNQLASQSMGSLDGDLAASAYVKYLTLTNNDIICVNRYIAPGAQYDVVNGPIDQSLSQAIKYISTSKSIKPLFVNETGAVTANYDKENPDLAIDKDGIMLHDMIFTPFFSGAAGPGSEWFFWSYTLKNNLWYHYARFSHAIKGINPVSEQFVPFVFAKSQVNFYGLEGKNTTIIWCRDANSNYKTELEQKIKPASRNDVKISLADIRAKRKFNKIQAYNPWTDQWLDLTVQNGVISIPPFLRSVVLKFS